MAIENQIIQLIIIRGIIFRSCTHKPIRKYRTRQHVNISSASANGNYIVLNPQKTQNLFSTAW